MTLCRLMPVVPSHLAAATAALLAAHFPYYPTPLHLPELISLFSEPNTSFTIPKRRRCEAIGCENVSMAIGPCCEPSISGRRWATSVSNEIFSEVTIPKTAIAQILVSKLYSTLFVDGGDSYLHSLEWMNDYIYVPSNNFSVASFQVFSWFSL